MSPLLTAINNYLFIDRIVGKPGQGLWSRSIALLICLAALKAVVIVHLRSHLYQTHGKLAATQPGGWEYFLFYLLALLVVLTGWKLSQAARSLPSSIISKWSWAMAGVGLLFACLNLHQGKKNYLYPVFEGFLRLGDLRHYLALDFFFAPPFLALYLVGYLIFYWLLKRFGKLWLSFSGLGMMGAFYLVLNLRDIANLGPDLLLIDLIGVAALISANSGRPVLSGKWLLLPILFVISAWQLFVWADPSVRYLNPYFIFISLLSFSLTGLGYLAARSLWPSLSHFLPFFLIAFWLLTNCYYPGDASYGALIIYGCSLPHYFIQEITVVLVLAALFYPFFRHESRVAFITYDLLALGLVLMALVDLQLMQKMGVGLDWSVLVFSNDFALVWRTIRPFIPSLVFALAGVILVYLLAINIISRWFKLPVRPLFSVQSGWSFPVVLVLLVGCFSNYLVQPDKAEGIALTRIIKTSPWFVKSQYPLFTSREFIDKANRLGFNFSPGRQEAPTSAAIPSPRLNLLLVILESTVNRYLSLFGAADDTQPRLKEYQERMELFPNFYAVFPNSLHARFALLSGIYPIKPYVSYLKPRLAAPSLFEILHANHYQVSLFYSSFRDYTRWNDYLVHRKIEVFFDASNMPNKENFPRVAWGVSEDATLAAIRAQLAVYATNMRPFFLTYVPAAPHMPYDAPAKQFEKFAPGFGELTQDYSGRYKNQLLYMDHVVATIIGELKQQGLLDQTVVIITSDHGEMVGEQEGMLGHGWRLEPWLCNIPLIIMNPMAKGYRINPELGSQIDVLPTALDLLQVPLPTGELYQGESLYKTASFPGRKIYLNSNRDRALISHGRIAIENPELKKTGASDGWQRAFGISFEGARTVFPPVTEPPDIHDLLDEFEEFQSTLIMHYESYQKMLQSEVPAPKW